MKLELRSIDLREKTKNEIFNNRNSEMINSFIEEIKTQLQKIKNFINNIDTLNEKELYSTLNEFCFIIFEPKDYLRILALMNKKHYTDYINIKTYMFNGKVVEYFGATTKNNVRLNDERLTLNEIRKLVKSNEFIVLEKIFKDEELCIKEKYENHEYLSLDVNNETINPESELFTYAIKYFNKEILKKDILYKMRIYYNELMHQIKSITKFAEKSKNLELKKIGEEYKIAYNQATNEKDIPKIKRIVVRHRKNTFK